MPIQKVTLKGEMPSSSSVGTSGNCAMRFGALTAMGFSLPALICGSAVQVSKAVSSSPLITASCACAADLYGMCVVLIFARLFSMAKLRCAILPGPAEP
ncbi:hypothetical protein D9M70_414220 [compost metagenome]